MQIQGVIFDMDGTLGDTVFVSVEAIVRTVFELTGMHHTHDEIIARFGPTEPGILKQLVPQERWEESRRIFLHYYQSIHQSYKVGAYPGIQSILDLLQRYSIRQAIVTGKSRETAEISLRYFNLNGYFEAVETGSIEGSAKEVCIKKVVKTWQIPGENVFYIGDAPSDIGIARRAGVLPISAAWAATADPTRLVQEQPFALFEQTKDLKNWLAVQLNMPSSTEEPDVS